MNQNFSKSKNLHESSKLDNFQWGRGTNLGGGGRGTNFGPLQKFKLPTVIIFTIF